MECHTQRTCSSVTPAIESSSLIIVRLQQPVICSLARAVERIIRQNGAVPATIALIDGRCRVGVEDTELEALCHSTDGAVKVSRRDLAHSLNKVRGNPVILDHSGLSTTAGLRYFTDREYWVCQYNALPVFSWMTISVLSIPLFISYS